MNKTKANETTPLSGQTRKEKKKNTPILVGLALFCLTFLVVGRLTVDTDDFNEMTGGASLLRGFQFNSMGVEVQAACGLNCDTCMGWWEEGNYCDTNDGPARAPNQVCGCGNTQDVATEAECEASYPSTPGVCPVGLAYAFGPHASDVCGGDTPHNRPQCQYEFGCTPGCAQCDSNTLCTGGHYGFQDTGLCCGGSDGTTCSRAVTNQNANDYGNSADISWEQAAPECFPPAPAPVAAPVAQAPVPTARGYWKEVPSSSYTSTVTNGNSGTNSQAHAAANAKSLSVTFGVAYGPVSASGTGSDSNTNTKTVTISTTHTFSGSIEKSISACAPSNKQYQWVISFPDGSAIETVGKECIPTIVGDCIQDATPQCPQSFCGCDSCECCNEAILKTVPNFPKARICSSDRDFKLVNGKPICNWNTQTC